MRSRSRWAILSSPAPGRIWSRSLPDTGAGRGPCPGSGCAGCLISILAAVPRTHALFDAGNVSATACLNVGGRLLETDAQGRVVHAHPPGAADCRCAVWRAALTSGADRRAAGAGGEPDGGADRRGSIDGTLSPLAQGLMQTKYCLRVFSREVITLSGGVGSALPPSARRSFSVFPDIGPLLATALHEHPRLRER